MAASYTTYDLYECIHGLIDPIEPVKVVKAWGEKGEEGGATWIGGFVLELKDGTFAYLTGWCDYTGWG